jgi:hypothetical protein
MATDEIGSETVRILAGFEKFRDMAVEETPFRHRASDTFA